jgi:2,3-bisphosphoglycerate-dependent phosphoglycerate mutase
MTAQRSIPYFHSVIVPYLEKGKNIFVSAHGNSLRSIMKSLDNLTDDEVVNLELVTGEPILYTYENKKFIKTILDKVA